MRSRIRSRNRRAAPGSSIGDPKNDTLKIPQRSAAEYEFRHHPRRCADLDCEIEVARNFIAREFAAFRIGIGNHALHGRDVHIGPIKTRHLRAA